MGPAQQHPTEAVDDHSCNDSSRPLRPERFDVVQAREKKFLKSEPSMLSELEWSQLTKYGSKGNWVEEGLRRGSTHDVDDCLYRVVVRRFGPESSLETLDVSIENRGEHAFTGTDEVVDRGDRDTSHLGNVGDRDLCHVTLPQQHEGRVRDPLSTLS